MRINPMISRTASSFTGTFLKGYVKKRDDT